MAEWGRKEYSKKWPSRTPLVAEVTSAAPVPDPGVVSYTFGDQVGTAQMEFSSGGWPTWQGQFGPFGQELDTQVTANNDKFAGLKRDSITGLDHATFRNYSSTTGRWLSSDPYDGSMILADPHTLNRYTYVGNKPSSLFDPSGLAPTADDPAPADGDGGDVASWFEFAVVEGGRAIRDWIEGHATTSESQGQQHKCLTCDGNQPRVGQDPIAQVQGQIVHVNFLVPTVHGDPKTSITPGQLNRDQCSAAKGVVADEKKNGTRKAAQNFITSGSIAPFNSTYFKNLKTNDGNGLDVDWFSYLAASHWLLYVPGKLLWDASRPLAGVTGGFPRPYSDSGESEARNLLKQGASYSSIFTPALLAHDCP